MGDTSISKSNRMKTKERMAIISLAESPHWHSCKTINANLKKTYALAFPHNSKAFQLSLTGNKSDTLKFLRLLQTYQPTRIVFIDLITRPELIVKALYRFYIEHELALPTLSFHTYGGLLFWNLQNWKAAEEHLKKFRCELLCASARHRDWTRQFFKGSKVSISICPFPTDLASFHHSPQLQRETRRKNGWAKNDKIILYAGRLSAQKNSLALTRVIAEYLHKNKNTRWVIAGPFDDISVSTFGQLEPLGQHKKKWLDLFRQLPDSVRNRIHYMGALKARTLNALYNSADIFVSLSTFHNEDFGLAVAEAALTGCSAILSDWGGYAEFKKTANGTLVPIHLTRRGLGFDRQKLLRALHRKLSQAQSVKRRSRLSQKTQKIYSIASVARRLQKIHAAKPSHFSTLYNWVNQPYSGSCVVLGLKPTSSDPRYRRLYAAYLNQKRAHLKTGQNLDNLLIDWLDDASNQHTQNQVGQETFRRYRSIS